MPSRSSVRGFVTEGPARISGVRDCGSRSHSQRARAAKGTEKSLVVLGSVPLRNNNAQLCFLIRREGRRKPGHEHYRDSSVVSALLSGTSGASANDQWGASERYLDRNLRIAKLDDCIRSRVAGPWLAEHSNVCTQGLERLQDRPLVHGGLCPRRRGGRAVARLNIRSQGVKRGRCARFGDLIRVLTFVRHRHKA